MSFLNKTIFFMSKKDIEKIPDSPLTFIKQLRGLTVVDIIGSDSSKTRVVTTLIHGNEPSGFIACHLWLRENIQPATNVRMIFCNPEAAKMKPCFTHRYIDDGDDLNRFFCTENSLTSDAKYRAEQIKTLVMEVKPEAIVDLHNTSGSSPAFSVSVVETKYHLSLARLFCQQLILTTLKVGAIMEQDFLAPIVTIECGGANQNQSHQVATNGLHLFFQQKELFKTEYPAIKTLKDPIRIELIQDASIGFAAQQLATADITLREDIESLNHSLTKKGEFIGWCDSQKGLPLTAIKSDGHDYIRQLLVNKNGLIYTQQAIQFFMITTNPEIATKDCIFYTTTN